MPRQVVVFKTLLPIDRVNGNPWLTAPGLVDVNGRV
jgi:hypothetical protein